MGKDRVVPIKKRYTPTPEHRAKLDAGREIAHANRKAKRDAIGPKQPGEKGRLQMLIDGELTLADLDDEELIRMQCRDRLGDFTGHVSLPAKIARAMKAESIRRAQAIIDSHVGKAVELLSKVVDDPRAKTSDRIRAADMLMSRGMGAVPQHIITHEGTAWDEIAEDTKDDPVVIYDDETG